MDQPDAASELEWLRWVYEELARIEGHWTAQIQDQQQRISTILAVNGVLLGFLTGAGFLSGSFTFGTLGANLLLSSLVLLCLALLTGLAALTPLIRVAKKSDRWLDASEVWAMTASMKADDLRRLCKSAAVGQRKARHRDRIRMRRLVMYAQLGLLASALIVLIAALIAFALTHTV